MKITSEQNLLGAILIDEDIFDEVQQRLKADDFKDDRNYHIFRAISAIRGWKKENRDIMLICLKDHLAGKRLSKYITTEYLMTIMEDVPVGNDINKLIDDILNI